MKVILEFDTNDKSSMDEVRKFLNEISRDELRAKDLELARLIHLFLPQRARLSVDKFMAQNENAIESIVDLEYFVLMGIITEETKLRNEILSAIRKYLKGNEKE